VTPDRLPDQRIPPALRAALEAYEQRLRCLFPERIRELRLFGSYARGEADEESDVDVLVVVDGLGDAEIGVVAGEATAVALDRGVPLAPLPMATERLESLRRAESGFARELDEEGIAL
jgi:uncharacterized protein